MTENNQDDAIAIWQGDFHRLSLVKANKNDVTEVWSFKVGGPNKKTWRHFAYKAEASRLAGICTFSEVFE